MSFDILEDEIDSVFGSSSPEDNIELEWTNNHENIPATSNNAIEVAHTLDPIRAILLHRPK